MEIFCLCPISGFKWSQADKHHLFTFFSFVYFTFNSTGVEAITVIFHGLSKLMRGTKARIKKGGNPVFLVKSLAQWGPSMLHCDQDTTLSLVLGNCHFPAHMFHLGMSDSNLAFGSGDFYC